MKELDSSKLPPNWKVCESCGKPFFCGGSQQECWCSEIKLSQAAREKLTSQFHDCLCRECLERAAQDREKQ